MITLGGHFRGPELEKSAIDRLIGRAMRSVADARGDWKEGDAPGVNVVFYVPGSLGDFPDIPELAAGRFSRKQKLLLVEVPVPRALVASGGSVDWVIDALRQACLIAAKVFEQKKAGPFDLAKANAIIDRVAQALSSTANLPSVGSDLPST